jgi:hypothetical protein
VRGVTLIITTETVRGRLNSIGVLILIAAAIAPTLSVKIPAMEDYLDHLSRMYILTTAGTIDANPYYHVSWALYPDIAMDVIIPLLGKFMQVETAGKIFFLTSQLLIISGAFVIELAVKRRLEFAPFSALMTLSSMPFSLGLVNFEFGTGLALWGIASWIALSRIEKWRCRLVIHALLSSIIFLAHFFALGIYGLSIGLYELRRLFESRYNARRTLALLLILACPVAIMFLLMLWSGASVGESDNEWWFSWKPVWFVFFLNGYSVTLAAGSACALAVLLFYGFIKRSLALSIDGRWLAFGFLLVFIAMPFKLFGSRMADIRMITAAFLILPAFMTISPRAKSFSYSAAIVAVAIIVINSSYVGYVWVSYQKDYKAVKASFTLLRQKSFILVGANSVRENSSTILTDAPMWRAPTLAVYYAKAFVSSLYTIPGTHAVGVETEWRHLAINGKTENYIPPLLADLKTIAEGRNVPGAPRYIREWQSDFDYVYLLGPHAPNVLPNILVELFTDRRFTLYCIRRGIWCKAPP